MEKSLKYPSFKNVLNAVLIVVFPSEGIIGGFSLIMKLKYIKLLIKVDGNKYQAKIDYNVDLKHKGQLPDVGRPIKGQLREMLDQIFIDREVRVNG